MSAVSGVVCCQCEWCVQCVQCVTVVVPGATAATSLAACLAAAGRWFDVQASKGRASAARL